MEVKVQQTVSLDEEAFDEVLVKYLRYMIERAEAEDYAYGPDPYVVEAMKVTHDWFAMPSDWYKTVAQMEEAQAEFKKELKKLAKKPAKMKVKTKK
jgi:hypothetical protein